MFKTGTISNKRESQDNTLVNNKFMQKTKIFIIRNG